MVQMMMFRFVAAFLLLCGGFAHGQAIVTGRGSGKHNLVMQNIRVSGEPGRLFYSTLARDLKRSGWFSIVTKEATASVEVKGSLQSRGEALRVSLEVVKGYGGGRFLSDRKTVEKGEVRAAAHELSDQIVARVLDKKGMASTRIVFVGDRGKGRDLYVCDADGLGVRQLTFDNAGCLAPIWSPDGRSVQYTSFHRNGPYLYQIDLKRRRRKLIAGLPGVNAGGAIAPDGKSMALILSHTGNPELYVKNLQTGKLVRLTKTPHGAEASPSWSPDGKQLVYVSDSGGSPQLYVISSRDRRPRRLTWRGGENVSPDWGPDGRIACASRRSGRYSIYVIDPRAKDELVVVNDGADYDEPSWAPDGRHLVATRTQSYRSQLYLLDTLGDAPIRLVTLSGEWDSPDWESN